MEPTEISQVALRTDLRIDKAHAGQRLDVLLARKLRLSRGYVRRLLGRERVLVGGIGATAKGLILNEGDRVSVLPFRHPELGPTPNPDLALPTLAEAHGLLAIDKPAGLPSHPLDYEETDTALNAVLAQHPEIRDVGDGGLSCGLVHRLDTYTSGVLVFATESAAWSAARAAFAERTVEKRYIARVHGRYDGPERAELRLANSGPRVRVVERGGQFAASGLRLLESDEQTSLVEVRPRTGVRHQIRATLAHLGFPVVGDLLYGSDAELDRHLLHAESIRIGDFAASAPVPEGF